MPDPDASPSEPDHPSSRTEDPEHPTSGPTAEERTPGTEPSPASEDEGSTRQPDDLPDRHRENRPSGEAAEAALVRRPRIGDTRPAPGDENAVPGGRDGNRRRGGQSRKGRAAPSGRGTLSASAGEGAKAGGDTRTAESAKAGKAGKGSGAGKSSGPGDAAKAGGGAKAAKSGNAGGGARADRSGRAGQSGRANKNKQGGRSPRSPRGRQGGDTGRATPAGRDAKAPRTSSPNGSGAPAEPVGAVTDDEPVELDEATLSKRRGRRRKGKPVGRYLMAVHVGPQATQIAVLEGRSLIEHHVSRPSDDVGQIHGNIYLGRVQNVLPGMEAAFVDIGTPKNAVLYRGDTRYDPEDLDQPSGDPRIEDILAARQPILCQVTKNPIGHKGARLTQEVSLPGRFVVLVPNSPTSGISKRLGDQERKRLRGILDRVGPAEHGIIVRTAAENITEEEIARDVERLVTQWDSIAELTTRAQAPALVYREPDMAMRIIREEFNRDYRKVLIDDRQLADEVSDYVRSITPALVDRIEHYDTDAESLPLFERHHVHEQVHKALDRKVWLPSGGSVIIEHTEALTVIDVNTGRNVGSSSLEETVYRNNLEAATEIARQLRLRDLGGIIVIDFVDMEVRSNRDDVIGTFRDALARDKTRTQVFDISELGLVEMTRKRIGEGLLGSFSATCPECEGRGILFDEDLLDRS